MKKLLVSVFLFVFAFTVPSYSAVKLLDKGDTELSIYGFFLLLGAYQNVNVNGSTEQSGQNNDLVYDFLGHSNIGLDFSVGSFFSKAEFRFTADNNREAGVFRHLYVGYKFDNGLKVLVGRTNSSTETFHWYDNIFDGDDGLRGYGTMGVDRSNMLRLSMFNVDLSFLALDNSKFTLGGIGTGHLPNSPTLIDVDLAIADEIMPAIEIAYNLNFGGLTGKVFGFYSGVSVEGESSAIGGSQREWIDAAAAGLVLRYKAVGVTTVFSAFYALNGNFIGAVRWGAGATPNNSLKFDKATGGNANDIWKGYNDINSWGTALSIGYDILDTLDITIGGGFQSISTTDNDDFAEYGLLNSYSAYVALRYAINKYFMIIPTVGYYVNYATNKDIPYNHATILAGIQLRVSF